MKLTLLTLFFAGTALVYGQPSPLLPAFVHLTIDSTKQKWGDWAEPNWLRYFGQDAADVDGDGDLDLLSGRYLYLNPGGDMTEAWPRIVLDDNVDGIFLTDVDGDAFADLIAMALPDIYWYEATDRSAAAWTRRRVAGVPATSHVNSQGFERAQVVPGGPEEFLIAGDGDVYLLRIPDKPEAPWTTRLVAANTSDEGIGVGDLDGDGDLDLAAGRRPEGEGEPTILVRYLKPGNDTDAWSPRVIGTSEHPIDRIEVADLNGDGRADIVVTEERYPGEEPDGNLWWFEQPADPAGEWTRHRVVTQYSMNSLDVADIDQDGDMDLITNEHKGPRLELQWWLNDGKGQFEKVVIDTGHENHLGTQLADLDRDGDLDIFGGAWDNYRFFHVWRNDRLRGEDPTGGYFREYPWSPAGAGMDEEFLRVGGKYDYRGEEGDAHAGLPLEGRLPLEDIASAEVIVERVQSHEDTRELQIRFNDGPWLDVPEPATLPGKATEYMFHANVRVPVPLGFLKAEDNHIAFRVGDEQRWGWPQNLIYGVTLRAYLQSAMPLDLSLVTKRAGQEMIDLSLNGATDRVEKVEYIGRYTGIDPAGAGRTRHDHYRMHGAAVDGHLGTAVKAPYSVSWNTEWLPDQDQAMQVSARVHLDNGEIYRLPPVSVSLADRERSVYLALPDATPEAWVTRSGSFGQTFDLPFDPATVSKAKLVWNSWSPCYDAGNSINGQPLAAEDKGPCYRAAWRELDVPAPALRRHKNEVVTAETPLHDGEMVHGMEVQYPGFYLLLRRDVPGGVSIGETTYEERAHFRIKTPSATYYLDRAGGGLSRLIDTLGNDWIGYHTEPWDQYPASAASAYRGLPNLVFGTEQGGAGHPGHDRMISEVTGPNEITSATPDGRWRWVWTFAADDVTLSVTDTPPDAPYWFLYEGTPGGRWDPDHALFGTEDGLVGDAGVPDFYRGESLFRPLRQVWFGDSELPHALQLTYQSTLPETGVIGYLGNTEGGVDSPDGMVVMGFGRGPHTEPLLRGPNTFRFGFVGRATLSSTSIKK